MGLLSKLNNGDTSLKSLKYGKDQPGGGSSNQPYIKNPIDFGIKSPAYYNEFLVRGGLKAPESALEDVIRLTKYFFDLRNPNGLLFIAKQNILSRVAVKTEASYGFAYGGFTQDYDLKTGKTSINQSNGFFNEGIYTPLSTLAQAGVGWAGIHVNKQGLDPTGLFPGFAINKYVDVVYDHNRAERNAEDPKIPYALYRKSQRAERKLERKRERLAGEGAKVDAELNRPASQLTLSSATPDSPARLRALQNTENSLNNFLQRWDAYRDKAAIKKFDRKAGAAFEAYGNYQVLQNEIANKAGAPPVYNNRLLKLWNSTGLNLTNPVSDVSDVLLTYSGGPDSILGIGKTKIHFSTKNDGVTPERTNEGEAGQKVPLTLYNLSNIFGDETTSVSLKYASLNPTISDFDLFGSTNFLEDYNLTSQFQAFDPSNISNSKTSFSTWTNFNGATPSLDVDFLPDFREYLDIPSNPTILSASPNYVDKNIEKNFNLGNPGQKGNISSYTKGKQGINGEGRLGPVDKVTAYPLYKENSKDGTRYPGAGGGTTWDDSLKDIIPFYIAILNNDTQVGGTYRKYMHFRAFIDNVSDSYNAEWKDVEYMGRAEKFYKYSGFSRKMSLNFKVVAQSREELNTMYDKLNFLASSLAPEYLDSSTSGYMAGNIAYITLGSYINDQPGIITELNYDISEESPWEIGIDDVGEYTDPKDIRQLPHMIEVKMSFTPIHKFRPEKQTFLNDTKWKTSTRLLATGKQRYLDQLRPETLNYDEEATQTFQAEEEAFNASQERLRIENASTLEAGLNRIAIQNEQSQNILSNSPVVENSNIATPSYGNVVTGIDPNNSVFNNTLLQ